MDSSKAKGYHAGCHTAYVFVTDGKADSPEDMIQQRQRAVPDEHFFIVSLGSGTDQAALKQLACGIRGIFHNVPDGSSEEAQLVLLQVVPVPPPGSPEELPASPAPGVTGALSPPRPGCPPTQHRRP